MDGLLRAGAFESAVGQEFNPSTGSGQRLASGVETRIIDLAQMITEATGNTAGIRFAQRHKWDTKNRLLACIDRARELIGYEPNTPSEVGLENTVRWFRDHWDLIEASARFGPGVSAAVREMAMQGGEQGVLERGDRADISLDRGAGEEPQVTQITQIAQIWEMNLCHL